MEAREKTVNPRAARRCPSSPKRKAAGEEGRHTGNEWSRGMRGHTVWGQPSGFWIKQALKPEIPSAWDKGDDKFP